METTNFETQALAIIAQGPVDLISPDIDRRLLDNLYGEMDGDPRRIDRYLLETSESLNFNEAALLTYMAVAEMEKASLDIYVGHISEMLNLIGKDCRQITIWDLKEYQKNFKDLARATRRIKTVCVRSFFKTLNGLGFTDKDRDPAYLLKPVKKHDNEDIERIFERSLSFDEVDYILEELLPAGKNLRNRVLFQLMGRMALRVSEACPIRWGKFRRIQGSWYCSVLGKGKKVRTVYVPQGVLADIQELYLQQHKTPMQQKIPEEIKELPLLISRKGSNKPITRQRAWQLMQDIAREIDRPLSPHDLRRTCLTQLIELGEDLKGAQILAGHRDISTTAIYVKAGLLRSSSNKAFDKREELKKNHQKMA